MKIANSKDRPVEVSVRYLGQFGFLFNFDGLSVAVDPYLTDSVDRIPGLPPGMYPWPLRVAVRPLDQ